MARAMSSTGPTFSSPVWAQDFLGREHLIPGGSKILATAVPLVGTKRYVASGTVVGRTLAQRDASAPFELAAALDDEVFIVAFDVDDALHINDIELVRPNTVIKENFLPGWATLAAAVQALVRDRYICIRGSE